MDVVSSRQYDIIINDKFDGMYLSLPLTLCNVLFVGTALLFTIFIISE